MAFDPNSLLRPGERRAGRQRRRRNVQRATRHPLVITRQEFGQGLKRSGRTSGQNFREAARRRLAASGMSGAGLEEALASAVRGRRYQRSQINSSNLTAAQKNLAKRRLQAQDVNYLRRQSGSPNAQIRVRTRSEVVRRRRRALRS